jgi:UrcA family protein
MSIFHELHKRLLITGTLTVLAIGTAMPAGAAQDEVRVMKDRSANSLRSQPRQGAEARSVTVRYSDLDVAGTAGVNALYIRLKTAARNVCAPLAQHDLAAHRDWSRCYTDALDKAVADTGSRPVAAIHGERSGRAMSGQIASTD